LETQGQKSKNPILNMFSPVNMSRTSSKLQQTLKTYQAHLENFNEIIFNYKTLFNQFKNKKSN
jgi:hypothetical protein